MPTTTISSTVTSSALTVSGGEDLDVQSGGVALGATVLSGGTAATDSGALAEDVVVSAGGSVIGAGELGGASVVYGLVNGATVLNSGLAGNDVYSMMVMSGGQAVDVTLESSVFAIVSAGGGESGGTIQGNALLFDYGQLSGATISAGNVFVQAGGAAFGDTIGAGGLEIIDWSGDASAGTAGGVATDETVLAGGALRISSAGAAIGTDVSAGGIETLIAGGVTTGAVLAGGLAYEYGYASGTIVRAGGNEVVESHGSAWRSVVSSGGHEGVHAGAVTKGATVSAGGLLQVSPGGGVAGGLTIAGGEAIIDGHMYAGQTVHFTGSAGTLKLNNLTAFKAQISGLHASLQKIDLGDFAFSTGETVSWTQTGTSGTLTVSDGAQTADLTLVGTYATGNFQLSDDKHGGTFIVDPPLTRTGAGRAAAGFVQAMAVFGGGAATGPASVRSHDTLLISAASLTPSPSSGRSA